MFHQNMLVFSAYPRLQYLIWQALQQQLTTFAMANEEVLWYNFGSGLIILTDQMDI